MQKTGRKEIHRFKKMVWDFYKIHGRNSLPWRKTKDPYKILVSEIMLQQTQVDRVIPKYKAFIQKFPTIKALAQSSNKEVMSLWKGLGYNNRALRLKQTAEIIEKEYKGTFPKEYSLLIDLPGVGPATAGDILAFAWNIPKPIIETNLRSVYIHYFFPKKKKVTDKEILALVEETLDTENPREWYWALMDYGSHLKKQGLKNNTQSKHYKKQSAFKGSNRELRSSILSMVMEHSPITKRSLYAKLKAPKENIDHNLEKMTVEGVFKKTKKGFTV